MLVLLTEATIGGHVVGEGGGRKILSNFTKDSNRWRGLVEKDGRKFGIAEVSCRRLKMK